VICTFPEQRGAVGTATSAPTRARATVPRVNAEFPQILRTDSGACPRHGSRRRSLKDASEVHRSSTLRPDPPLANTIGARLLRPLGLRLANSSRLRAGETLGAEFAHVLGLGRTVIGFIALFHGVTSSFNRAASTNCFSLPSARLRITRGFSCESDHRSASFTSRVIGRASPSGEGLRPIARRLHENSV
jgi:hypothetical protein